MNNLIKFLLDLNDDILVYILKTIYLNFRLINNEFKEIVEKNNLKNTTFIFDSLNILKFAIQNGYKINENTMPMATKHGDLEIMEWLLREKQVELSISVSKMATNNGDIHNIEWLYNNNCKFSHETYYPAISNSNTDIIMFLKNKYSINHHVMT